MSRVATEVSVENVIVHPLVLLSVVDHYNRVEKLGKKARVVGALLGSWRSKKVLDITNSFAVPFEEDDKDQSVWFMDHDYLESMYNMFKKVNAKEKIVGWYHTGPKLHSNDVLINDVLCRFCSNSILVIVNLEDRQIGLPTDAYVAVEEVHDDGTPTTKTFEHVPSEIGAEEAEEVGVEHLLRNVKDTRVGTLSEKVTAQLHGLKGFYSEIRALHDYLRQVISGQLPVNHQIIYQMQDIFNLLPDFNEPAFQESIMIDANDQKLAIFMSTLVRSIIALHSLIDNRAHNKDAELKALAVKQKEKEDKAKVGDGKEEKGDGDKVESS